MIKRRHLLGAASVLALPTAALANGYPQSPINLVIPLAAGDAADTAARLMGEELSRLLKVPVIAVNRPGAGGSLGVQSVIRAPKDGYTLLYAQNSPLTIRRVLEPDSTAYDPLKDLTPLALATRTPSILVARSNAPFANLKEMVEQSRHSPGGIRVGNAGPGSAGDISVQLINAVAGAELATVPYKGAGPAVNDLLGGHVEAVVLALGAVSAHLRNGAFKGLAISSSAAEFPDVPTLTQLGYRQELQGVWFAFFAPAGVPKAVIDTLLPALEKAVRHPRIAAQLLPMGIVQDWALAAALVEEITREHKTVSDLAKRVQPRKP